MTLKPRDRVRYVGKLGKSVLRDQLGRVTKVDKTGAWVKPLTSGQVSPGWFARKDVEYRFAFDELEVVQDATKR